MAKKKTKQEESLIQALAELEQERGISTDYLMEKIAAAVVIAVKKDYGGKDNITVALDPQNNRLSVSLNKTVVETVEDPDMEMLPEEAAKYVKKPKVGDVVSIPLKTQDFGRIAAQTAKHVIRQGLREAERGQQLQEFQRRNQELVTALVDRVDPATGNATLLIADKAETVLPKQEQLEGDVIREGDRIKVYVVDVKNTEKGPRALVSRTHPGLVKRLFETNVPEIYDGTVEVKAVSREAGSRTKLAVLSHDANVDAVGACIGQKSARINDVMKELGSEKIDVIEYSDDPATFIAAALAPAKVVSVEVDPDGAKACKVTVPDAQLSLAIGNKGQNARLAARLTGWKIDIRPESGFYGEESADKAD